MFHNVTTHHTPAYDFAPNPDKQWILRHTERMLPIHRSFTDMLMTKRLQTLQSVDSAVEQIVQRLSDTGQLANTYIFYTSDHGYHLGQFGLVKWKAFPFDFHEALEEDSILAKDDLSIHERLSLECKKQWYQAPCSLAQKWVCRVREDVSLKMPGGVRAASETDPPFPTNPPRQGGGCQHPVVHRQGQHHLWGDHNLPGLSLPV